MRRGGTPARAGERGPAGLVVVAGGAVVVGLGGRGRGAPAVCGVFWHFGSGRYFRKFKWSVCVCVEDRQGCWTAYYSCHTMVASWECHGYTSPLPSNSWYFCAGSKLVVKSSSISSQASGHNQRPHPTAPEQWVRYHPEQTGWNDGRANNLPGSWSVLSRPSLAFSPTDQLVVACLKLRKKLPGTFAPLGFRIYVALIRLGFT